MGLISNSVFILKKFANSSILVRPPLKPYIYDRPNSSRVDDTAPMTKYFIAASMFLGSFLLNPAST